LLFNKFVDLFFNTFAGSLREVAIGEQCIPVNFPGHLAGRTPEADGFICISFIMQSIFPMAGFPEALILPGVTKGWHFQFHK